jgi:hypothetical protein
MRWGYKARTNPFIVQGWYPSYSTLHATLHATLLRIFVVKNIGVVAGPVYTTSSVACNGTRGIIATPSMQSFQGIFFKTDICNSSPEGKLLPVMVIG